MFTRNPAVLFVAKLIGFFIFFYLFCLAVIGVSSPGNLYLPFVASYLDFISWIKHSLVWGSHKLLWLIGYHVVAQPAFVLRFPNGPGVFIARDCVGFGVYSFWAAYMLASHRRGQLWHTIQWVVWGIVVLWLINVLRISLLLIALQKYKMNTIWGLDHHTWFNIVAYAFIFLLIFLFNRQQESRRER